MFKLLPSQEKHAARLKDSIRLHGCALDASSPGAGKTYIACAVARELGFQPLIVTTKATIPSWQRTAEGFELDPVAVVNYESIRTGKSEFCTKYQREAYSRRKTSFFWNLPPGSMLIFDEVQKCRRHSSVNAQLLLAAARQGIFFLPLIFWLPARFGASGIALTQPISDALTFLLSIPLLIYSLKAFTTKRDKTDSLAPS